MAVVEENDMSFVYVVSGDSKNQEKRTIETGLSDSEGNVEVLSGLVSGELVLINPPKK
jgi:multidrug efflux pump subunit AcrA (membrane-fusion protein)